MQLTDAEREFIEPYLPIGRYGSYPERLRHQFEGAIWRIRTGGRWREMPQEFGPWPDRAVNQKKKGRQGGRPLSHDAELCKARNTVERLINKLKA